jgi:hypothetical protein
VRHSASGLSMNNKTLVLFLFCLVGFTEAVGHSRRFMRNAKVALLAFRFLSKHSSNLRPDS